MVTALLAITEQLVDGLGNRFLDLGRLALDHYDWQAIQEQDNVWHDMVLCAEDTHLELADGDETIVIPVLEVDKSDRRTFLAGLAVLADAGIF